MAQQMTEDQIIDAINQLPFQSKRKILVKLLGDLGELEEIIDSNQERMRVLCRERGLDWDALSEKEREDLVDQIIHED